MAEDSYRFYRSASGAWLTGAVPVAYMVFPVG